MTNYGFTLNISNRDMHGLKPHLIINEKKTIYSPLFISTTSLRTGQVSAIYKRCLNVKRLASLSSKQEL